MGALLRKFLNSPNVEQDSTDNLVVPQTEESRNEVSELVSPGLTRKVSYLHLRNTIIIAGQVVGSSTRPVDTALQENYKIFSWPTPELSHCEL